MKLTPAQIELLAEARLYMVEADGMWFEHGQSGKAIPKLVKLALVEFRPKSGGPGNYVAPAIKLTAGGIAFADEYLKDQAIRELINTRMQSKIAYIRRNLLNER